MTVDEARLGVVYCVSFTELTCFEVRWKKGQTSPQIKTFFIGISLPSPNLSYTKSAYSTLFGTERSPSFKPIASSTKRKLSIQYNLMRA